MMKRALFALGTLVWAMSLTACDPECRLDGDCEGTDVCNESGVCVTDDRPLRCDNGRVQCASDEVCDTSDGACKTCTADNLGCSDESTFCDVTANDGAGACIVCSDNSHCTNPEFGICDTAGNGGIGACVTCTETLGCFSGVCDTSANDGAGQCVSCLGNSDCSGDTAVCDTSTGTCVECTADAQCTTGDETLCRDDNTCVACLDSATGSGTDEGCDTALPVCDATTASCREPTCEEDAAFCPQCADNTGCDANLACVDEQCEPPATNATIDAQIQAFIDAAAGVVDLPIEGALVTYLKPAGAEAAGFFVQGDASGPAIFVEEDPATTTPAIVVGDRISFTATNKVVSGGVDIAEAISDLAVISSEHPVWSVAPVGFKVDVSAANDLVSALDSYESELVTFSGTVTSAFDFAGPGHQGAEFTSTGFPAPNPDLLLRVPDSVLFETDLDLGCEFTVEQGIVWRFNATAQLSAEHATDVVINGGCPAPTVASAFSLSATSVVVEFTRQIDPATVVAADFTIDGGVTVTNAVVDSANARRVNLTIAGTTPGTRYTVTVDTVSDRQGTAVGTPNSAGFWGFGPAPTSIVINELEADNANSGDEGEFIELRNTAAVSVFVDQLVVVLGNGNGRFEYQRVSLANAVDNTGAPSVTVAAGGFIVLGEADFLAGLTKSAGNLYVEFAETGGFIQNGSPDAVGVLNNVDGTLLDALNYEATAEVPTYSLTTNNGTADYELGEWADTATVFGNSTTEATSTTLGRDAASTDTDDNEADFSAKTPSPGVVNP